jgi:hypothetical protein
MDYAPTTPADRCTAHDGAHPIYLGQCVAIGEAAHRYEVQQLDAKGAGRACLPHQGLHLYVRGFCVTPGQRSASRWGICPQDGCRIEVEARLDIQTGRVQRYDAETGDRHWHPPAPRVELDQDVLAAAIVAASRADGAPE